MPRQSPPPDPTPGPGIQVANRQRKIPLRIRWLRQYAEAVLPRALYETGNAVPCAELPDTFEITLVSDRTIARVHQDFMGLPDPTDIITFQHGEMVISAETAAARAEEFGHAVEAEIALYITHGLMHLRGYDDTSARAAAQMRRAQERLWRATLAELPLPVSLG